MVLIQLSNEVLGFSSAHISKIGGKWRLHGHNFQIKIRLDVPSIECGKMDYFENVRKKLKTIDHKDIVPEGRIIDQTDTNLVVSYEGDLFTFPVEDCYLLKGKTAEIIDLLNEIPIILSEFALVEVSLSTDGLTWIEKQIKGLSDTKRSIDL